MSTAPPAAADGSVLASDAERETIVARLHAALGEGRLDLAETETRVAAAYAARHRHDLPPLLADLPTTPPGGAGAPTWASIWSSIVWRTRLLLGVGAAAQPPTARQCRVAGLVVVLVAVWLLVCAVAGALVA